MNSGPSSAPTRPTGGAMGSGSAAIDAALDRTEVIMPKLTDAQLVILSTAAQRDDGAVQPVPKSLKLQGGAAASTLKSLLKHGLLAEQPGSRGAITWRKEPDRGRLMLVITDAGRQAADAGPARHSDNRPVSPRTSSSTRNVHGKKKASRSKASRQAPPRAARPGTKQSLLIDLLGQRHGATIAEAVKATGWQSHSVRGAISGNLKRKLGLSIASEKVAGRSRVYRIIAGR